MRHQFLATLTWCTVAGLALGADLPQKKAAAPSGKTAPAATQKAAAQKTPAATKSLHTSTTPSHSTGARSTTGHPATTGAKVASSPRNRYSAYRRPVPRSSTQQGPTADRYREIQDALASRGYLKTPSSGVWDKDSIDAMQRFQKDKNLDPTGKLTARSLGELGLGPKPQETTSPAIPTASLSANPGSDGTPLR